MATASFVGTVTQSTPSIMVKIDGSIASAPARDFVAGSPAIGDRVIVTQIGSLLYITGYGATLAPSEITGAMKLWPVASVPAGYLICDGTAVSRTVFADLFSLLGTTYGVGNGSTTFNLPDMRGRVPVAVNSSDFDFTPVGKTGGTKTVSHSHGVSGHSHSVAGSSHTHDVAGSAHTHTGPSHTHTQPTHSHGLGSVQADAYGAATTLTIRRGGHAFTPNIGSTIGNFVANTTAAVSGILLSGSPDQDGDDVTGASGTAATGSTTPATVTSTSTTPLAVTSGSTTGATDTQSPSVVQPYMALNYIIKT